MNKKNHILRKFLREVIKDSIRLFLGAYIFLIFFVVPYFCKRPLPKEIYYLTYALYVALLIFPTIFVFTISLYLANFLASRFPKRFLGINFFNIIFPVIGAIICLILFIYFADILKSWFGEFTPKHLLGACPF